MNNEHQHVCPRCNQGVPFGLQRCFYHGCGEWIYWQKYEDKGVQPFVRQTPLHFPQKAEAVMQVDIRKEASVTAAIKDFIPAGKRLVVTGCVGEWFFLEDGSFAHFTQVGIFGQLPSAKIVDPKHQLQMVPVLAQPSWGSTDDHAQIVYEYAVGKYVSIWEIQAGWVRINTGPEGHWLQSKFIEKKTLAKLQSN